MFLRFANTQALPKWYRKKVSHIYIYIYAYVVPIHMYMYRMPAPSLWPFVWCNPCQKLYNSLVFFSLVAGFLITFGWVVMCDCLSVCVFKISSVSDDTKQSPKTRLRIPGVPHSHSPGTQKPSPKPQTPIPNPNPNPKPSRNPSPQSKDVRHFRWLPLPPAVWHLNSLIVACFGFTFMNLSAHRRNLYLYALKKISGNKVLLTFLHSFERCYSNKKMFSNTTLES